MLWRWLRRFRAGAPEPGDHPGTESEPAPELARDPLNGELDLHAFRPNETGDLVREYVIACHTKGVLSLRIVHGKGKGTQRRIVHAALDALPELVLHYRLAEAQRGGWGATLVELRSPTETRARGD